MTKKESNGYTVKEMLGMMMDQTKENDEKRVTENKRIYNKMDEIVQHNAGQDKKIEKIESKQNIIWKGLTAAVSILTTFVIGIFIKK